MIKGFNINGNIEKVDYESLANKPFYSETKIEINRDIIPLQEVEMTDEMGIDSILSVDIQLNNFDVVVGGQYNLEIDGQTHLITTFDFDGVALFGNFGFVDESFANTGEDYFGQFAFDDGVLIAIICYKTTEPMHTIRLSHVDDIVPIIVDGTYTFTADSDFDGLSTYVSNNVFGFKFQDGDVFNLTFNGQRYENITCGNFDGDLYIGNAGIIGATPNTGENCAAIVFESSYGNTIGFLTSLPAGDYTILLEKVLQPASVETVYKIDNKYLDINCKKDIKSNVIFEKDVLIDDGKVSIREINENMAILQDEVEVLGSSKQLVEGILPSIYTDETKKGLSANRYAVTFGECAWIEGDASVLRVDWMRPSATLNVNGSDLYYNTTIDVDFADAASAENVGNKIYNYYRCVGISFYEDPNTIYYLQIGGVNTTDKRVTLSYLSFFPNQDEFSIDGYTSRGIATIRFLVYNGDASHAEGVETIATMRASHAEGIETVSRGEASHAEGYKTTANGQGCHAEGYNTTASGRCSHAEGLTTTASGVSSHAEGEETTASGNYGSHAEGGSTTASGDSSHAEGAHTTASDYCSHAEGYNTTAGYCAHAEGEETIASKWASHAEGSNTTASGEYSHAEGLTTTASEYCSHAEGYNTTASGEYSHAEGWNTTASGEYSHVQGRLNIEDTENKYAHIVGNGVHEGSKDIRSNAHTLDWDGNAWYAGSVEGTALILCSKNKRFKITVDDSGTLTTTEITK